MSGYPMPCNRLSLNSGYGRMLSLMSNPRQSRSDRVSPSISSLRQAQFGLTLARQPTVLSFAGAFFVAFAPQPHPPSVLCTTHDRSSQLFLHPSARGYSALFAQGRRQPAGTKSPSDNLRISPPNCSCLENVEIVRASRGYYCTALPDESARRLCSTLISISR
jgi:hypothetical protein